jgi:hypothetical protein
MSITETYAQNLWQLGNIMTGFAVTEALVVWPSEVHLTLRTA